MRDAKPTDQLHPAASHTEIFLVVAQFPAPEVLNFLPKRTTPVSMVTLHWAVANRSPVAGESFTPYTSVSTTPRAEKATSVSGDPRPEGFPLPEKLGHPSAATCAALLSVMHAEFPVDTWGGMR